MTIFSVYIPPASVIGDDRHMRTQFIPESKAFIPLVLPFIWLLWYRLWWPALFYVLISTIMTILLTTELGLVISVLTVVPGIYLFLEGNELRRKKLERRGWHLDAVVEGPDLTSAEIRYFYSIQENERDEHLTDQPTGQHNITKSYLVAPGIDFLATPEST